MNDTTGKKTVTRTPPKGTHKLPLGIKLSFGIGDIASNFFIVTTGMYLLYFLTNVVGVNPALAGVMLLIPKLWDVILDPIMGAISDVTRRASAGGVRTCSTGQSPSA